MSSLLYQFFHMVGHEVALDVRPNARPRAFEVSQQMYLRPFLQLSTHSHIIPLFTETRS